MPQITGGWWHHRQTAKAPVDLRIFGGFAIYVDGSVDGFNSYYFSSFLLFLKSIYIIKIETEGLLSRVIHF